jgi:hypothetical protein
LRRDRIERRVTRRAPKPRLLVAGVVETDAHTSKVVEKMSRAVFGGQQNQEEAGRV